MSSKWRVCYQRGLPHLVSAHVESVSVSRIQDFSWILNFENHRLWKLFENQIKLRVIVCVYYSSTQNNNIYRQNLYWDVLTYGSDYLPDYDDDDDDDDDNDDDIVIKSI